MSGLEAVKVLGRPIGLEAVKLLDPELRVIVELRLIEMRSEDDIAERLNLSVPVVRERLRRALHILDPFIRAQGRKPKIDPQTEIALQKNRRLVTPPTMLIDRVVRFFWTAKTYDRVFKPARADLISEWEQAHVAGEARRAWYIKNVLSRWVMMSHIAAQIPISIGRLLRKIFQITG